MSNPRYINTGTCGGPITHINEIQSRPPACRYIPDCAVLITNQNIYQSKLHAEYIDLPGGFRAKPMLIAIAGQLCR